MKQREQKYIMKDYGRKSTFASFLPGLRDFTAFQSGVTTSTAGSVLSASALTIRIVQLWNSTRRTWHIRM